jgi:hypothetical protein
MKEVEISNKARRGLDPGLIVEHNMIFEKIIVINIKR